MTQQGRIKERRGRAVFVATVFTTFITEQLLWDGQFITYPMFRRVRDLDERHFVTVHKDYVKSLGVPTYLPTSLNLLSTLAFLFVRPARIGPRLPLLMNALNAVSVLSTFRQLVPIHVRIDREEQASAEDVDRLIGYNRVRFGLTGINSVILLYLLWKMLAPRSDTQAASDGPGVS